MTGPRPGSEPASEADRLRPLTNVDPLYVVAPSRTWAQQELRSLPSNVWVYVARSDQLRGTARGTRVAIIDGQYLTPRGEDVAAELRMRASIGALTIVSWREIVESEHARREDEAAS